MSYLARAIDRDARVLSHSQLGIRFTSGSSHDDSAEYERGENDLFEHIHVLTG